MVAKGTNSCWSLRGRESLVFLVNFGWLECYSCFHYFSWVFVHIVSHRILGLKFGCCRCYCCFCTYGQSWICILVVFVNMDYVLWILFQWNLYGTWKVCCICKQSLISTTFVLHLLLNFVLLCQKASNTDLLHN